MEVVVKLEDDMEERPCTEISPEKEEDKNILAIRSIKTQIQDNTSLESNTLKNAIWRRRSTLVNIISKAKKGKRRLEENMRCKKIGIELDVGSGSKQKLDLQLLTNGVMKEIAEFADELSTIPQKHYIAEILEYNFDISFENSKQKNEFANQTWQRLVELKPFKLSMLNQPWMLGLKPYYMVTKTSSQRDPLSDSGIITSEHLGYAEICVKSESDMMANQDIKVEAFYTVSEETRADLYPLCQEIGLDLDVTYKGWSKEKLDMDFLTKGVMIEVAKYTKELCGTYKQIVLEILEHNFDLDLQTVDSELFRRILSQFYAGRLNKTKRGQAWYETAVSLQKFRKWDRKLPPAVSRRQSERQKKLQDIYMRPRLDYYPFCEQAGIDLDVHSKLESKEKHDLQVLTNGVMFEIRKYVRRNRKKKAYSRFLYDVLEYNFDMSFPKQKWLSFKQRLVWDVEQLKTYHRDVAINPSHATEVFALHYSTPREKKKRETVTQPARTSERIFKKKTNPYTDGTADVGQIDDLGYMCSLENPGLEPSLKVLCAAGDGHLSSPAPPLTPSYDTHTALCDEEVKLEDKRNKRRDYRDYFPLCEQAGIDFDVHSKLQSKEKHDLQVLTNGVMFEIRKYVRINRKKKAYSYFLRDILDYNFDIGLHNQKWHFFTHRLVFDVKRLAKTYYRDNAINSNHATKVFALYSKIPKVRKKKETVTQPARTSERIFKKKTCKLSNFERTNPYTDGTADVGQLDDIG